MSTSGLTVWLTGLSGAGKSTLARGVVSQLQAHGLPVELLDADQAREHLAKGLGFSREDREENVRRLAFVAGLLTRHGVIVVVAAMSPYRQGRQAARSRVGRMLEVWVDAPLPVCEARDPVGIYRRFRAGEIRNLSGVDDLYEAPLEAEVHCHTATETLDQSVAKVVQAVLAQLPS